MDLGGYLYIFQTSARNFHEGINLIKIIDLPNHQIEVAMDYCVHNDKYPNVIFSLSFSGTFKLELRTAKRTHYKTKRSFLYVLFTGFADVRGNWKLM